jgi:hypothetical protein
LSSFGSADTAITGTVDAGGVVAATLDDLGGVALNGSSNGTTFTGTVSDSFVASGFTVTVSSTMTAAK